MFLNPDASSGSPDLRTGRITSQETPLHGTKKHVLQGAQQSTTIPFHIISYSKPLSVATIFSWRGIVVLCEFWERKVT